MIVSESDIDSEEEYVPDHTEESECGSETDNDVQNAYGIGKDYMKMKAFQTMRL